MNDDIIGKCWHCGRPLGKAEFGRETTCLGCAKPTRCCRNCRFYAPGRPNDCDEPMAEAIADKARANFCEFFDPSPAPRQSGQHAAGDDLLKAARDLFK